MDIIDTHFPIQHDGYDLFEGSLVDTETMDVLKSLHPVELRLVTEHSGYEGLDQHLYFITQDHAILSPFNSEIRKPTPEALSNIVESIAYCYLKDNFSGDLFPILESREDAYLPDVEDDDDFQYDEGIGLRYPGISEETANEWVWTLENLTWEVRSDASSWGRMFRSIYRDFTGTDLYFNDRLYDSYIHALK